MAGQHHEKLATRGGEEFAKMLLRELPQIATAIRSTKQGASFTVTAQFTPRKEEGYFNLVLKPRVRTPREPVEINLAVEDRQLSLFEGEIPTDEDEGFEEE